MRSGEVSSEAYRRDIVGLRAVAVLAIVGYHAFPKLLPGGFIGVDAFFVISGFLITRIIADQCDNGRFTWGEFYLRRARRILPAFAVIGLATAGLACWIELPGVYPGQLGISGGALSASALFGANILFAQNAGYFSPAPQQSPFLHLWSLGVEEQFYLIWPALIVGLSLRPIRRLRPWLAVALLIASLAVAQMLVTKGSNWAFFGLPARAWEFLAGGIISLGVSRLPASAGAANAVGAAGLVLIAASLALVNEAMPFPGLTAVPICLGAALVLWSGQGIEPGATAILRSAPAVAVGNISYSLYLWHWPILVLAADFAQHTLGPLERLGCVLLSFALAALTWRFIEQPWRRGPMEKPWRRLASFFGLLGAVFGVGAVLFFTRGLPGRLSPTAREAMALEMRDVNPARGECFNDLGPLRATGCRIGAPPSATDYDVLIWGDSHADALTPGVVAWARRRGLSVREAARAGCPPFLDRRIPVYGPVERNCRASTEQVLTEIGANPKLQLIVIVARWPLYRDAPPFYDMNSPRVGAASGFAPHVNDLTPSFRATIDAVSTRSKARIVIIGPVPELTFIPPQCVAQARHLHRPEPGCWSAPADLPLARARPAEAEIRQVLADRPNVRAAFPSADLCSATACLSAMDRRLIYFDDDHLSASGARRLVPTWLDRALEGAPVGTGSPLTPPPTPPG